MQPVPFPRYADAPNMILLWTTEEAMPVLIGIVIGVINGSLILPLLIGVGITTMFRRFRETKPDGHILHLLYWHGLMKAQGAPNPFLRWIYPA